MSAWDHAASLLGAAAFIAMGFFDAKTGQTLTLGVDIGLIAAGGLTLGLKGTIGLPPTPPA